MSEHQADEQPESDQTSGNSDSSGDNQSDADSHEELETSEPGEVGDDNLPEDLQPTEDNPLARHPGQTGDEDDEIGADREGDAETAPLDADDADYGAAGSSDDD